MASNLRNSSFVHELEFTPEELKTLLQLSATKVGEDSCQKSGRDGIKVMEEVLDSKRSSVLDEAKNRTHTIKARGHARRLTQFSWLPDWRASEDYEAADLQPCLRSCVLARKISSCLN